MFSHSLAALALSFACAMPAAADALKVTLLGTGSPLPSPERFSQSTLVEAGQEKLLFDFGRGAPIRLTQLGVPIGSLTAHFITHFHSDHVGGLPDVWMTGWIATPFGGRETPMVVYGPEGTEALTGHLTEAFSEDARVREADEHLDPAGIAFDAHDAPPGKVYERNGVTVTAFEVNHGPLIKPAYGYRVDYDGKAVVISGDTKKDERIAEAAKGADLLIHEVAYIDHSMMEKFPSYQEILDHHTRPSEAGETFAEAEPRLAAFSHIVSRGAPGMTQPEVLDAILAEAHGTWDGPIVMGADLMSFTIDGAITVTDPEGETVLTVPATAAN
ncbi:MBL fold metallo-hydrolase [Amaricoccus solimangrovi]|uniref:MBL fold metallo-hydrolase n=2 Tax=Amaricoccus solimangrovi TaxID=2589815 RepID=A0A501WF62_9RHOB|nr:MBL fold metallo-hydrolase [Amaricoccus solimangrovi]